MIKYGKWSDEEVNAELQRLREEISKKENELKKNLDKIKKSGKILK